MGEKKALYVCHAGHKDVVGKYVEDGEMNKTLKFKKEGDSSMHIYQNNGFWYIGTLEHPLDVYYRCQHCPPNGSMPPMVGFEPDTARADGHPIPVLQEEPCPEHLDL